LAPISAFDGKKASKNNGRENNRLHELQNMTKNPAPVACSAGFFGLLYKSLNLGLYKKP